MAAATFVASWLAPGALLARTHAGDTVFHAAAIAGHLDQIPAPFLIREHARKFQWSVALATVWRRKG